jgi:hypothetical protein
MKTIILFSSIFYLIGLKIGSTIEGVKNSIIPTKPILSAPMKKSEKSEKNYQFKSEEKENDREIKKEERESTQEKGSAKPTAPADTLYNGQG